MTIGSLAWSRRTTAVKEGFATKDVRTLIADHLGVDVKRVTDEAHFAEDLGADWLDRLELMIVIEDQFVDVEITDDDVDRIDVVGDLMRHIESAGHERRQRRVVEKPLQ
jgi:acyl carrier protein